MIKGGSEEKSQEVEEDKGRKRERNTIKGREERTWKRKTMIKRGREEKVKVKE